MMQCIVRSQCLFISPWKCPVRPLALAIGEDWARFFPPEANVDKC
jgi:hypothetical protein